MEAFPPHIVFDRLYFAPVMYCEEQLKFYGLVEMVRHSFITIATTDQALSLDSAQAHLARIQGNVAFRQSHSNENCAFCIVQGPSYTLDCHHRICEACIPVHGNLVRPWCYELNYCPICQSSIFGNFALRPATAGDRVLKLGGTDANSIFKFLNDISSSAELKGIVLKDQFDTVIATGMGMSSFCWPCKTL